MLTKIITYYKEILSPLKSIYNGRPLEHVYWMVHEVEKGVGKKDLNTLSLYGEANRWLGFIQGVLWVENVFTWEQLESHLKGGLDEE